MAEKYIYRIRKISNILGENEELKNQYIYFAKPEQLNDPLEGYKDIIWRGDKIVWKNLFKHYLLCLLETIRASLFLKEGEYLNEEHLDININYKHLPCEGKLCIDKIYKKFFSNENINKLIDILGSRTAVTRKSELIFILSAIHEYALEIVFNVMKEKKVLKSEINIKKTNPLHYEKLKLMFEESDSVYEELNNNTDDEKIDLVFKAFRKIKNEMKLVTLLNEENFKKSDNFYFVFTEFTDKYVKKLENLLFPQWYTACFMRNCKNSSVWGHYGEGHTGVCLKYRAKKIAESDFYTLNLNLTSKCRAINDSNCSFIPMKLYKINYEKKFVEVNFFRSLGNFTIDELRGQWYQDEDGNISECAEGILVDDKDEWRKNYWRKHINTVTTKSKDWEYENEYRIILEEDMSNNYLERDKRQIKYDFYDLEGIIFGINTSLENKLDIIRIIKSKCKEVGRKDFSFYQAEYNHINGEIYYTKLDLIKI